MKRFWQHVTVEQADGGYAILLDARPVKTPKREALVVPDAALADAIAREWRDVGDKIDPAAMPVTGFANAAIDRVAAERHSFVDSVASFGESDFFCYRAESPDALVQRQEEAWGKWLRWAEERYGITFEVVQGIVHKAQPEETVARLKEAVAALNDYQLAAASKLTHLSGSLVAVLALVEGEADAETIWPDLILDELWQEEYWGADDFALKNRRDREKDFKDAAHFLALAKAGS